jgi:hypothetical protein
MRDRYEVVPRRNAQGVWLGGRVLLTLFLSLVLAACGDGSGKSKQLTAASHPSGQERLPTPTVNANTTVCNQVTINWNRTQTASGHLPSRYHIIIERVSDGVNVYSNNSYVPPNPAAPALVLSPPTLQTGIAYRVKLKALSDEQGNPGVQDSFFSDFLIFTLTACTSCSPVGWLPPVTHSPSVQRPSTLPIKFCPTTDLGPTHTGTLTGPAGCTVCGTITFRRTDEGIYLYQFRSGDEPIGAYTVDSGGAVPGTQSFTTIN